MRTRNFLGVISAITVLLFFSAPAGTAPAGAAGADAARATVTKLVAQVRAADYEGDRAALARLYSDLAPYADDKQMGSRVLYWRGFAMWRRALNGQNETPVPKDVEDDLNQAVRDFNAAVAKDPGFMDAKVSAAACMGTLLFAYPKTANPVQDYVAKVVPLLKESEAAAPENPRVLWVVGGFRWWAPGDREAIQASAMDLYQKGLAFSRKQKSISSDPLEPSWGEAELLMSLAWSNLNRATPDLNAAEHDAQAALALVPNWHYVRDILMRMIRDAISKQNAKVSP